MKRDNQSTEPAWERFSRDYRFALIVLVAITAAIFVTPFAVFRFLEGTYSVAIADTLIVAIAAGAAVHAWRTGKTRVAGIVIAFVLALGAAFVSSVIKLGGAFWLYPVIMFIFYITSPMLALVLAAFAMATIILQELVAPGAFFDSSVQMASFFVSATTTAIFSFVFALRTNRQRDQLTRWATMDPLTGLYNRRNLDEELRIALANRDRHGMDTGLIILDLDNFKKINDEAGHAAGDQVLRDLAELVGTHTRVGDRAFRYGGDEFVILLPSTDARGLQTIASNLVRSISENLCVNSESVTASLGAALLSSDDDVETWNKRADRCLYMAKEKGRNQAVVDSPVTCCT